MKRKHFSYQNLCISNFVVYALFDQFAQRMNKYVNELISNEWISNEFSAGMKKREEQTRRGGGLMIVRWNTKQWNNWTMRQFSKTKRFNIHLSEISFVLYFGSEIVFPLVGCCYCYYFYRQFVRFLFCRQETIRNKVKINEENCFSIDD